MKIHNKRVVLVDDDQDDREIFAEAISSLDIPLSFNSYSNAKEILAEIESDKFNVPDIMFLDINMPEMSGFEFLEILRNMEQFKSVPVIAIYSTSSDHKDVERSIQYGANGYITKPTNFQKLQSIIADVLDGNWKQSKWK